MGSLRFRFGKILVWVGETRKRPHGSQASAILKIWHCGSHFALVYAIVHEKPRMDIRESWHNCPWQYFQSCDRRIVILSVFMSPDCVVLPASRNKAHRKLLTSFLGAGGPWPVILRHASVEMAKFVCQLWRHCFINPWIQTTLFLIIAIAATSAAVIWQFAGCISPIPLWLIISISTDYIPPLLTKYSVYNVDKYFSRNK